MERNEHLVALHLYYVIDCIRACLSPTKVAQPKTMDLRAENVIIKLCFPVLRTCLIRPSRRNFALVYSLFSPLTFSRRQSPSPYFFIIPQIYYTANENFFQGFSIPFAKLHKNIRKLLFCFLHIFSARTHAWAQY